MNNLKNVTNKLIAGAVFAGVGVGSFAGVSGALDSANAATSNKGSITKNVADGRQHGEDLSKLAKSLGVTVAQLQNAMETVHKGHQAPQKARHEADRATRDAELAKKLGVTTEKLKSVMDANRPTQRGVKPDFSKIAKDLGVTEAKLKAAFTPPAKGETPKADGFAKDLAKALNISEAKVTEALKANAPTGAARGGEFRGGPRGHFGGAHESFGGGKPPVK